MKTYRIIEHIIDEDTTLYDIQRLSIFGFWYYVFGFYSSLEDAKRKVESLLEKPIRGKRVVWSNININQNV